MSQDVDIGRVAAALKSPGLRYRTFGNEPVRPASLPATKAAVTIPAVEMREAVAEMPRAPEGPQPTMRLIADGLSSPAVVPGFLPTGVAPAAMPAAVPAWPLLDALRQPQVEPDGRSAGTLVRLFGGLPPAGPLPAPAAPLPAAIPRFAAPLPPTSGPLPPAPLSAVMEAAPPLASAPALVPAGQVTTPLADVFQGLARGAAAPASPFAALRLPRTGPGVR